MPSRNVTIEPTEQRARQPASSDQGAAQRKPSLFTVQGLVEMIDVKGVINAGVRLTLADASSLQHKNPSKGHSLSTLALRPLSTLDLPKAPPGVTVDMRLLPPTSKSSPCNGSSWAWVCTAYSVKKTATKKASVYGIKLSADVVKQTLMEVDIQVPQTSTQKAWSATSALRTNRIAMTRSGTQHNGQQFAITELINMTISIADNVPDPVQAPIRNLQRAYPTVISMNKVKAGTSIMDIKNQSDTPDDKTASPSTFPTRTPAKPSKPRNAKTVMKTVAKRAIKTALRKRPSKKQ